MEQAALVGWVGGSCDGGACAAGEGRQEGVEAEHDVTMNGVAGGVVERRRAVGEDASPAACACVKIRRRVRGKAGQGDRLDTDRLCLSW